MNEKYGNYLTILLVMFYSSNSFASTEKMLTALNDFGFIITAVITLIGVISMVKGAYALKDLENPNHKTKPMKPVIFLIIGALAFNYAGTINLVAKSYLNDKGGYCGDVLYENTGINEVCLNSENSEAMNEVYDRVGSMNGGDFESKVKEAANVLEKIFWVAGLCFYLKSMFVLNNYNNGQQNATLFKAFGLLIFATLLCNFFQVLDILVDFFKSIFT